MCDAIGCGDGWVTLIPSGAVSPSRLEALFDQPRDQPWQDQKEVLALCRKHQRLLRRKDGVTLGYHRYNGKLRAYVKEEHF